MPLVKPDTGQEPVRTDLAVRGTYHKAQVFTHIASVVLDTTVKPPAWKGRQHVNPRYLQPQSASPTYRYKRATVQLALNPPHNRIPLGITNHALNSIPKTKYMSSNWYINPIRTGP